MRYSAERRNIRPEKIRFLSGATRNNGPFAGELTLRNVARAMAGGPARPGTAG